MHLENRWLSRMSRSDSINGSLSPKATRALSFLEQRQSRRGVGYLYQGISYAFGKFTLTKSGRDAYLHLNCCMYMLSKHPYFKNSFEKFPGCYGEKMESLHLLDLHPNHETFQQQRKSIVNACILDFLRKFQN